MFVRSDMLGILAACLYVLCLHVCRCCMLVLSLRLPSPSSSQHPAIPAISSYPSVRDCLTQCYNPQPRERPSAAEVNPASHFILSQVAAILAAACNSSEPHGR